MKPLTHYSDVELLALTLNNRKDQTSLERARSILSKQGSLSNVIAEDKQNDYLSHSEQLRIQAGKELATRAVLETKMSTDIMSSPALVRQYLALRLHGLQREVFSGLFLDNRHRVIEYRELFKGTIDSAAVYPREVVKTALQCNSAVIIFAHNHPSGVAEPSDTDIRLTKKLTDALSLLDIRVLDHLIIGQGVQTSMAERGLM